MTIVATPNPLGRIAVPDPRDHILKSLGEPDAEASEAVERGWRYWWQDGWWGDQWYTPRCVSYAWTHLIEDGPTTRPDRTPSREATFEQGAAIVDPADLYSEAQLVDEWPGVDYDGTSVRAGAKVLQRLGLISSYQRLDSPADVVRHLLVRGPVVAGTTWYEGMTSLDKSGVMNLVGRAQGGHAYLLNGVNVQTGVIRVKNSWGREWGDEGNAALRITDLAPLMADWGEFFVASEAVAA